MRIGIYLCCFNLTMLPLRTLKAAAYLLLLVNWRDVDTKLAGISTLRALILLAMMLSI
jgi:hypothetical protein